MTIESTINKSFILVFFLSFMFIGYNCIIGQNEVINELLITEWNSAGAVKSSDTLNIVKVYPTTNLNKLLNEINNEKGIILLLNAGKYYLNQPLQMKSNVYLEGIHKDSVWIISEFNNPFNPSPFETPCSIEFEDLEFSGISKVSLIYEAVEFKPYEQDFFHEMWDKKVFKNDPNGDTLLYVGHIGVKRSKNVIIENCNIINAGTDPIILAEAHHVSVLNSHIKGAYNKGGKGNGYFNIDANSSYVLVKNNRVEKIRHLSIQNGAHHNVIVDNDLEVDVNFHNGDAGYNLVEGNIIRIPEWHGWHCFSAGMKKRHAPPGPHNYIYNNFTQYKQYIPEVRPHITEYGDTIVYKSMNIIDTLIIKKQPMVRYALGEIDKPRMSKSNLLYMMNEKWDANKRVYFVKKMEINNLYQK